MTTGNTNWGKITHNTKTFMQVGLAGVFVVLAGTAIYAAAKGAALPLAFLAQPWVIAAIVSLVAVYFIVTALSSYYAEEAQGKDGVNGKDADFSVLLGDAVKSGTIVEENQQLSLKLSKSDYEALTNGKNVGDEVTLNVLLADKLVEVKFQHITVPDGNGNYKAQFTSVGGKNQPTDMKAELGMAADSKSLKVAVSNEVLEALKGKVATNLADVALENAISNAKKV